MNINNNKPIQGIHTDFSLIDQPKNTYRFALNAVDETLEGDSNSITNENASELCFNLTQNYVPIGSIYITKNRLIIFSVTQDNSSSEIGLLDFNCVYTPIVNDSTQIEKFNFNLSYPIKATYRLRRGCEDVIYFVDGLNNDRYFNITEQDSFKDAGGNWNVDKFRIDKIAKVIPNFDSIKVTEEGNLLPGSYNVGIALLDQNFNSTEVITVSETVIIYHDKYSEPFEGISGSTTEEANYFDYQNTGKSIEVDLSNLDDTYFFYRLFLISANTSNGLVSQIAYTNEIPITQTTFVLTGDNTPNLSTEAEVLLERAIITSSDYIEQIDNRLLRGSVKGVQTAYCDYQRYASKITTNLELKTIKLNDIQDTTNPKLGEIHNNNSLGFMPGEIYALGIVYISSLDGSHSPAFHIPGRGIGQVASVMDLNNQLANTTYLEKDCLDESYWGEDRNGNALVGTNVRHHRFPTRATLGLPLFEENVIIDEPTGSYKHTVRIFIGGIYQDGYNYDSLYVRVRHDNAESGETNVDFIKSFVNTYVEDDEPVDLEFFLPEIITDSPVSPYTINQIKFVNPNNQDGIFFNEPVKTTGGTAYDGFANVVEIISKKVVEYTTQIMGLEFSDIELPPNTSGYYIVRMERDDFNKTVLDSGLISTLLKDARYECFASWLPETSANTATERWALTNPEFKFNNKQFDSIDRIVAEGFYSPLRINKFEDNIEDVVAGTSYDRTVSKRREEDEDGFSLHTLIRYNELRYSTLNEVVTNNVLETAYLDALGSTVMDGETVFNVSGDNKVAILNFTTASSIKDRLYYVTLRRDLTDPYADFQSGAYYKQHNNPLIGDTAIIHSGDTYVSCATLTNTIFYDIRLRNRESKSGIWRIIGGSLLVAFGVVASILTLGLGVPVTALIIGAGLSLAASGINQAIIKKTYQEEYEKGLKETIKDADTVAAFGGNPIDDEVQYFSDICENVFLESAVNMFWRVEPNYGPQLFQETPQFLNRDRVKDYILDKLTVVDTENDSGRLYQGYPNAEVYFTNKDYLRRNRQKIYFPLPIEYNCCSDCNEVFNHRVHFSEQSFQEELTDHYRNFLPNNYRDLPGEFGVITDIFTIQNNIYIHCEEGLWHLPQNLQERVAGDIVTFIGTGSYFSLPPRPIVDSETGLSAGNINFQSRLKTPYGVFFVCEPQNMVFRFDGNSLKPISSEGNFSWFKKNTKIKLNDYYLRTKNRNYLYANIPNHPFGTGYHSVYDSKKERIIFTKRDFLIDNRDFNRFPSEDFEIVYEDGSLYFIEQYQETIDVLTAMGFTYNGIVPVATMQFERQGEIREFAGELLTQDKIFNLSWTFSYSLKKNEWRSFHSYLPNMYFQTPEKFLSFNFGIQGVWEYNIIGKYQNFYGTRFPFIIEYVSNSIPLETRIFNNVKLVTEAKRYFEDVEEYLDERFITFNKAILFNSRQCSGLMRLTAKDTQGVPANYLFQQVVDTDADTILIDRNEKDWTLNNLRDYVVRYDIPMFSKKPEDLQDEYFIDKVINEDLIDFFKPWYELESFRDKYLALRFIFDSFDDIKLSVHYSLEEEQKSYR